MVIRRNANFQPALLLKLFIGRDDALEDFGLLGQNKRLFFLGEKPPLSYQGPQLRNILPEGRVNPREIKPDLEVQIILIAKIII